MTDLVDFLLARIAEDEAVTLAVIDDMPRWDFPDWETGIGDIGGGLPAAEHEARWSPSRVLAECEAKRRIVEMHDPDGSGWGMATERVLELLAFPYADHPDYREEWQP